MCFTTDAELANACVGDFSSIVIGAQGGDSPYTFALASGALPTGMSFDPVGLITGIPTVNGISTFDITVTDAIGSTQTKEFTLRVIEITSPATLPDATQNSAYSEALTSVGNTFPISWAITAGALPTGLSMPATGVISGTPTVAGTYNFTATMTDADDNSCSKDFSIEVNAIVGLRAYWTCEDVSPADILDATGNGIDLLQAGNAYSSVTGVVAQGIETSANNSYSNDASGMIALLNNPNLGFTVCGWAKAPATLTEDGVIWVVSFSGPSTSFDLRFDPGGDIRFRWSTEEIFAAWPQDSDWHFYRAWFDPADQMMRLQIDLGTISVSNAIVRVNTSFNAFFLAGATTLLGNRSFDETGYWTRVLSDAEAANLYNGGGGITFGNPSMPP